MLFPKAASATPRASTETPHWAALDRPELENQSKTLVSHSIARSRFVEGLM
jgi:hypothetical protein